MLIRGRRIGREVECLAFGFFESCMLGHGTRIGPAPRKCAVQDGSALRQLRNRVDPMVEG